MSIVLKENEWAEEMIASGSLGKKPTETMRRVARYYLDKGYSKSNSRLLVEKFLLRCDEHVSVEKWSDSLDYAMSRAIKYKAIDIDYILITTPEIERICALPGRQLQRLAFTLLCLSKYWMAINPECDFWVNNKDNEIMSMANINTSIKRQSSMYWTLKEEGLIQFSKKVDNTNVRVLFAKDGDVAMKINDFRNLGYQYLRFFGEPYFECENCGIISKINEPKKGRKQKYCRECAVVVNMRQRVNSVMQHRGARNQIC